MCRVAHGYVGEALWQVVYVHMRLAASWIGCSTIRLVCFRGPTSPSHVEGEFTCVCAERVCDVCRVAHGYVGEALRQVVYVHMRLAASWIGCSSQSIVTTVIGFTCFGM